MAFYLEDQRRACVRTLGNSAAVDSAIARAVPDKGIGEWVQRMSHRSARLRLLGVFQKDVIKHFRRSPMRDVKRNPEGPWRDLKVAIALVSCRPGVVRYLPLRLRDNDRVLRTAVSSNAALFQWASDRLKADLNMVKWSLARGLGPDILHLVPSHLRSDRGVAIAAVEANGESILHIDHKFRDDEDIIVLASFDYPALTLACERIKQSKDVAILVCRQCRARVLGPNLMSFVEDTEFLAEIAATLPQHVILCRIRLLSGKAVLTSFSIANFAPTAWRTEFLGLHVLYPERSGSR